MDNFICPISHKLFNSPVMTNDGYIFEYDYIQKWLLTNNTNPINNRKINKILIERYDIKNIIEKLMDKNHNLILSQNKIILNYDRLISRNYTKYNTDIELDLTKITKNSLVILLKNTKPFIHKKIIDFIPNLEIEDEEGLRPIHYICKYCCLDVIKYIVNKNVDLNAKTKLEKTPLHYICEVQDYETIKYFINLDVDLECCNNQGWNPLHVLCRYRTLPEIKLLVDKNINLEVSTKNGYYPLHIISIYQDLKTLQYFTSLNININIRNKSGNTALHLIIQNKKIQYEGIKHLINKGLEPNNKNYNGMTYYKLICHFYNKK